MWFRGSFTIRKSLSMIERTNSIQHTSNEENKISSRIRIHFGIITIFSELNYTNHSNSEFTPFKNSKYFDCRYEGTNCANILNHFDIEQEIWGRFLK